MYEQNRPRTLWNWDPRRIILSPPNFLHLLRTSRSPIYKLQKADKVHQETSQDEFVRFREVNGTPLRRENDKKFN